MILPYQLHAQKIEIKKLTLVVKQWISAKCILFKQIQQDSYLWILVFTKSSQKTRTNTKLFMSSHQHSKSLMPRSRALMSVAFWNNPCFCEEFVCTYCGTLNIVALEPLHPSDVYSHHPCVPQTIVSLIQADDSKKLSPGSSMERMTFSYFLPPNCHGG